MAGEEEEGVLFCFLSSSVLPPRPGESDCVPAAVSELVSGFVYFATFAFVGSITFVGYSKEGSCRRHLELGRPGYSLRNAETLGLGHSTRRHMSREVSSRGLERTIQLIRVLCFVTRCRLGEWYVFAEP
jgi:hypothetical protein